MSWGKKLWWGVEFVNSFGDVLLIGTAWDKRARETPSSDPCRPLLFKTRALCREWCKNENDFVKHNMVTARWKFRPVRVAETFSIKK